MFYVSVYMYTVDVHFNIKVEYTQLKAMLPHNMPQFITIQPYNYLVTLLLKHTSIKANTTFLQSSAALNITPNLPGLRTIDPLSTWSHFYKNKPASKAIAIPP